MTTNDVLIRHNFVSKIPFKNGLSKDLKVKIMSARIEYSKIRKAFDEDLQEFAKEMSTDELQTLQQKQDRTEEETQKLQELIDKLNSEYNTYINKRSLDEVTVNDLKFTMDEYNEIVSVVDFDTVDINNQSVPSADFLEILYNLFVEE